MLSTAIIVHVTSIPPGCLQQSLDHIPLHASRLVREVQCSSIDFLDPADKPQDVGIARDWVLNEVYKIQLRAARISPGGTSDLSPDLTKNGLRKPVCEHLPDFPRNWERAKSLKLTRNGELYKKYNLMSHVI